MNVSKTFLNKMIPAANMSATQMRSFSVAYNVKSKFEDAYKTKMESLGKVTAKTVEPENKAEYG
jgi:hypothetical protein